MCCGLHRFPNVLFIENLDIILQTNKFDLPTGFVGIEICERHPDRIYQRIYVDGQQKDDGWSHEDPSNCSV